MALTEPQEAALVAHLDNTNNPHSTTTSQGGITTTDDLPEGVVNFYSPNGLGIEISGLDTYDNIIAQTTMVAGDIWISSTDDVGASVSAGDGLLYDETNGWENIGPIQGPSGTITVGTNTTGAEGTNSIVTNSGTNVAAVFDFTIPVGDTGTAATITAGTTTTGAEGSSASVTNSGTSGAAVFDFTIPVGDTGTAATITAGTTTTGAAESSASVTNSGTSGAAIFDFTIPQGDDGLAATISVNSTTTGAEGSSASVTNSGTTNAASLDFTIPVGDTGTAATITAGTTTTGAEGSSASVTNSGTSGAAVFNFTIPIGATGEDLDHVSLISGTHAAGTTDTYGLWQDVGETISLGTYPVYNGADGLGAGDMLKVNYDPQSINADSFARANHTGTQSASTISDFDTEVANNPAVTLNTAKPSEADTIALIIALS